MKQRAVVGMTKSSRRQESFKTGKKLDLEEFPDVEALQGEYDIEALKKAIEKAAEEGVSHAEDQDSFLKRLSCPTNSFIFSDPSK